MIAKKDREYRVISRFEVKRVAAHKLYRSEHAKCFISIVDFGKEYILQLTQLQMCMEERSNLEREHSSRLENWAQKWSTGGSSASNDSKKTATASPSTFVHTSDPTLANNLDDSTNIMNSQNIFKVITAAADSCSKHVSNNNIPFIHLYRLPCCVHRFSLNINFSLDQ